ncbi:modifier of mdg4 isoform X3 [Drosophila busckii]|uniref:modifier of mdg4 isoform X3 n=1 Tax=Drosophila busckii TaxID=30019 RepID=UPI00083EEC3D|nr:modifier of mdg4 isoform X3 [Drosophila busckii]
MADDEQFSLCWNNFNTNLSAGFHESLCRGDLVDVSLAAEGHIVKAHRLVLSVCSPFFRKMFTQMPSNTHAIVFLNNVSHSALKDLIQFMYCGEVNVKQDALPAFISTAESLQIKGLTDNDPAPQPPQEPTPPPAAPQVQQQQQQQQQQQVPTQRVQRQQQRASARYKIETVDDVLGDDKGTTQIVIQTTAVPQATIVQQQPQHIQAQHLQTGTTTTTATLVSTNKRSARGGSMVGSGTVKRSKTSTANVIDSMDTATETATTATTQLAPQQITVQTTVVSADTKVHQGRQAQQQQATAQEEEYIELPMDMPTKSEPDYSEEHGDVAVDGDTSYVEDDTYGDMRYDDSYFTENEDQAGAQTAATASGSVAATTSKAVVKQQQSQSYSDSSFVDTGGEQGNTEAQDDSELLFIESPWSTPCLVLNGYMYNCHSRKNHKEYWRCHNYSKKAHEERCRSRCVLENGKLKSITGGLHNHMPHKEKIEKIIQRNRLATASTELKKTVRTLNSTELLPQPPKQEPDQEEEELVETEQQHDQDHHLLTSDAATLQLSEHELMHASLMLIDE